MPTELMVVAGIAILMVGVSVGWKFFGGGKKPT